MDKKKLVLTVSLVAVVVLVFALFAIRKNQSGPGVGENQPKGLSMEKLIQTKNDSEAFNKEAFGKIKTIEKNILVLEDDKSPLKKMTKGSASPTFSLSTSEATSVFFFEKGKPQEKKSLSDLHSGDVVMVEYNNLTKEAVTVNVSIGGAELKNGGAQNQPLLK